MRYSINRRECPAGPHRTAVRYSISRRQCPAGPLLREVHRTAVRYSISRRECPAGPHRTAVRYFISRRQCPAGPLLGEAHRTAAGTQDRSEALHQSATMPIRTAAQRGTQDCRWCTQDRSEALHQSATMPIRTAAQRGTQDRSEVLHQSERMHQFVSERLLSGKFSILVSVQLISEQFLSGMERGCQQCTHRSAQVR